jgi:hypothetical protein
MINFIIEHWQTIATVVFLILSFVVGYKIGKDSADVDNFPKWP